MERDDFMKQVGIPTCPYCGRKVNLIRMWTLKRDGEFVCPGCGGISNVYHAPVMTLFAAVCAVIAFVIFAVTRFILDQVNLMTCIYVFLPFAVFFVGSMFLVQLREPVVRQGRRESAAARRDEAVLRRRQRQAIAANREEIKTYQPAPSAAPVKQAENLEATRAIPTQQRTAAPVRQTREPLRQPSGYTDISSRSSFGSTTARRTPSTTQEGSRDIYSSSRGQGYSYSTSAHLRQQDGDAAELRRRKIEMLKRLQQEQNREYQSSDPKDSGR